MFLEVVSFVILAVVVGGELLMVAWGILSGLTVVAWLGGMLYCILPDLQRFDRWLMSVLEEGAPPEKPFRGGLPATLPDVVARDIHRAARGGR